MNLKTSIKEKFGKGYKNALTFKGRYLIIKGSRGSKKSTNIAQYLIYNMMKYYHLYKVKPNVLVIRQVANTHKGSTFAQLKWAINNLGVAHLWKIGLSPLSLTYIPSGQVIIFRGLNDSLNITSITVEKGHLCWCWFEEAFQIQREEDFDKIDLSIRGKLPEPLYHQLILTLNPWSERHWIKKRFFDVNDPDIYATTINYTSNEFLSDSDIKLFEKMKIQNPKRYRVEGLGEWGVFGGQVYDNYKVESFDIKYLRSLKNVQGEKLYKEYFGIDFGYTQSPTAFVAMMIKDNQIFIFDEIYQKGLLTSEIYASIVSKGFKNELIIADCEDPRTIAELKRLGIPRIKKSKKGAGSVIGGIQKIRDYEIIIHPNCVNFHTEIENYRWDEDKTTKELINTPKKEHDHLLDAMRYALENLKRESFSWI